MSEPVFLVAGAMVLATLLMIVKTIAAATTGHRASSSEMAQLREQVDHYTTMMDETQAALANQSTQIAELQERLDFTERLLTQARDRAALGSGEKGG
jgi:septal ring factor EnvC (AmiA/AmiB activator)